MVKDTTGGALIGVRLTLRGPANRVTETGPDGHFAFEDLPNGEYELTAVLGGFVPAHRTFRLVREETVTLPLTLSVQLLEQIFVTAAKTGERDVQTIPLAVSVLPAADLERVQVHTVEQLAGRAPSVTFSQNTGFAQLTIRGIGTNAVFAGSDPSSAVTLTAFTSHDLRWCWQIPGTDRVEVLRGPQGTLYGRNAVGGALNIITKNPTNEVEASARVDAGNLDLVRVEAGLSGPLL